MPSVSIEDSGVVSAFSLVGRSKKLMGRKEWREFRSKHSRREVQRRFQEASERHHRTSGTSDYIMGVLYSKTPVDTGSLRSTLQRTVGFGGRNAANETMVRHEFFYGGAPGPPNAYDPFVDPGPRQYVDYVDAIRKWQQTGPRARRDWIQRSLDEVMGDVTDAFVTVGKEVMGVREDMDLKSGNVISTRKRTYRRKGSRRWQDHQNRWREQAAREDWEEGIAADIEEGESMARLANEVLDDEPF